MSRAATGGAGRDSAGRLLIAKRSAAAIALQPLLLMWLEISSNHSRAWESGGERARGETDGVYEMTDRTLMALFDPGHRLNLPGGYWMQKDDDTRWQIGQQIGEGEVLLGFSLEANVHFGDGGSFDSEAKRFAEAMNHQPYDPTEPRAK